MAIVCLSLLDRPRRIGRPFAPRTGVQLRAGQAGVLEREQVVARGDAGAAVADDLIRRHVADRRARAARAAPRACGTMPVLVEIPLVEMIRRAGNVARRPCRSARCRRDSARARARRRAPVRVRAELRRDRRDVDRHLRARRSAELRAARAASRRSSRRPPFGESISRSRRRAPRPRRGRASAAATRAGSRTCRCPDRRRPPARRW